MSRLIQHLAAKRYINIFPLALLTSSSEDSNVEPRAFHVNNLGAYLVEPMHWYTTNWIRMSTYRWMLS
jgi:hypothetical protein